MSGAFCAASTLGLEPKSTAIVLAEEALRARGYYVLCSQFVLRGQFVQRRAAFVGGAQMPDGIRPELARIELFADELVNVLVPDPDETLDVSLVVVNDPILFPLLRGLLVRLRRP